MFKPEVVMKIKLICTIFVMGSLNLESIAGEPKSQKLHRSISEGPREKIKQLERSGSFGKRIGHIFGKIIKKNSNKNLNQDQNNERNFQNEQNILLDIESLPIQNVLKICSFFLAGAVEPQNIGSLFNEIASSDLIKRSIAQILREYNSVGQLTQFFTHDERQKLFFDHVLERNNMGESVFNNIERNYLADLGGHFKDIYTNLYTDMAETINPENILLGSQELKSRRFDQVKLLDGKFYFEQESPARPQKRLESL